MLTLINRQIARKDLNGARDSIFTYTELLCSKMLWNAAADVAHLAITLVERGHDPNSHVTEDDIAIFTSLFDLFSPLYTDEAKTYSKELESSAEQRHLPHIVFINDALKSVKQQNAKIWASFDQANPDLSASDASSDVKAARQEARERFAKELALIEAQLHGLLAQAYAAATFKTNIPKNRTKFAKQAEDEFVLAMMPTEHVEFLVKLMGSEGPSEDDDADEIMATIRRRQVRFVRAALVYLARGSLKNANAFVEAYRVHFPGEMPSFDKVEFPDNTNPAHFLAFLIKLCEYDAPSAYQSIRELYEPALCTPLFNELNNVYGWDVNQILSIVAQRYFNISPPKSILESALSLFGG